jgi:hypothetical protein
MITRIDLTQDKIALIDAADLEWLSAYRWQAVRHGHLWYAVRRHGHSHRKMHREILDAPAGITVDHINGDGLDNRRHNLRLATPQQQNQNRRTRKGVSVHKGVVWHERDQKWQAQIWLNGKYIYLGSFNDEIEAARAYNEAARAMFGEFAHVNTC